MAVAPLESSSTPPRDTSTEPTRPSNDSMEDIDPQSTRKRPRLDSGSGACETLATDKSSIPRMSEQSEPASAVPEQETSTSASRPPTNRVTINMKSPKSIDMSSETLDSSPDGAAPRTQSTEIDGNNASAAISVSSSPAQSPEIEVAEVEDMDQDPNASNWKPLGQALRDRANAEVVQLHDQYSLADMFPKFHDHLEQPGSLEQIALIIEKGSPSDVKVFLDLKTWLDHVVHNLDQLTHETFIDDRDFWEDLPILIESLLRRGSDFQPDEGEGTWACFEEFFLCYAQLALHLIHLDTLGLKHMLEHPEIQVLDLKSKFYLAPLGWILQISGIPFFQALEKMYGSEVADMVARIGDHLGSPPLDTVHQLSEFCRCAMALVPQWPILSQSLITVLVITGQLVESGFERRRYGADDNLIDSPVYMMTLKSVYGLLRDLDEKYQVHISKKSPWVGNDTSEALISRMSAAYQSICLRDPRFALQTVANDLSIDLSSATTPEDRASVIYYDWRFRILKKQIIDGRMELRVHGMETMQSDLVNVWKQYFQGNPPGIMHPVVSYLVAFLREHKIVDYVLGIDSHPQLISRSYNIVGFLIVTSTYTDVDTDTIWETVIESQDPRTVSEVLGMFSKIFQMHQLEALLYLSSKLLDLPLDRFDGRMIEHAEQLLHTIREKYAERNRHAPWDTLYVDAIPVRLCVRLIRDSSAAEELSVEQKTHLQKFAGAQLSQFINVGLSETDKMETYERCIQDIAEMNQFTTGSLQALHALLPNYELQEIRKLATDFDLTRLVINEISHVLEMNQTDFTDPFSRAGFGSRVNILARIIDKVPDTITDDLADILWKKVFTSKNLVYYARRSLWDMLCAVTVRSTKRNPFVDHCIEACLPQLLPGDYSLELLSFVKQTIGYEIRFDPPQLACENEVISIPGMDRVWNLILNAPPCSIETEATDFAIEVYLDHNLINRSPRSAVEATHIALVDRCVEQLKSAAAKLKAVNEDAIPGNDVSMITAASDIEIQAEELRFSRSLLFLRQLLHGLRTRPQYSPPQGPPPDLPGKPVKGELVSINYQAFHGGASSKIRSLRIGDLSTASELVDRLVELTGFSKFSTIYGGQKIGLLENPDVTVRDLKLRSGLLIVRRDADSREVSLAGRRQSLTLVDSEVLKHFDNLYDLLFLEDHLAREIYEFLVVFPPQERALQLVKSENKTEDEMFPMEKPYSFLYSVNALSACLAEESSEASPNESFISRSIAVLVAALTRSELSEAIEKNSMKLSLASSLVECLRTALSVTYQLQSDSPVISNPVPLVERLLGFLEIGRHLPSTSLSPIDIQKLICNSFAILTDTSVHGLEFWTAVKRLVQLDQLLVSLLLDEKRQEVRKEISEIIVIACSPLQMAKDSAKSSNGKIQKPTAAPENTLKTDVLTTIWDAFARTLPQAANFVPQSQEFFEVALLIFYLMGEKSPSTLRLSEYLKQWGAIMREYRTEQFVGREIVDHLILGCSRLIKACLNFADTSDTQVETCDLAVQLFDNYLFPSSSVPSSHPIVARVPVMHEQTRQELYAVLCLLSKRNDNYLKMVARLDGIILQDCIHTPTWCLDRSKVIRSPEGYAGLKNLSNTCYMNSLLTQLFMNVGFREFMLQIQVAEPNSSQRLLEETKKVFGNMQDTWLKSVDPQEFVDTIRTYENEPIDVTIQMDVDEFYNLLFDRWEAQIVDPEDRKKFRSFYGGQLVQQIKSKECSHISERLEPFSAIQCDIKGKANLEESLQAYVEGEVMQGDNKYSCTSCGCHVDAVKRACLKDVPDNLIFHLKRFDFDMVTMMRSKINDEFQFPEHIDMNPFKVEHLSDQNTDAEPDVFQLVGVLVHSGTAESGHYYSYIRERPTADSRGSWVEFNDSDVSRFDPTRIPDQCFGGYNDSHHSGNLGPIRFNKLWNAYMLFYQRVSSMESARSVYKPVRNDIPVHVALPVALGNQIAINNELFIRAYCLFDPGFTYLVRYLLSRLHEMMISENKENSELDKSVLFIALDAMEQLVSRSKDPAGSDGITTELLRAVEDIPTAAHRVLQWIESHPAAIRNLVLRSPHASVRDGAAKVVVAALAELQRLRNRTDLDDAERMEWHTRYINGFESVVSILEDLWPVLHTVSRSWDDYFDFLLLLSGFGVYEIGVLLENGFLQKCLEMIWIDRDDHMKLKRKYIAYCRLVEKGRKFSYRQLMDLTNVLLTHVDLLADPCSDSKRRQLLENGKYPLSEWEDNLVRTQGRNGELLFLKKILQQYQNPQACRQIVGLLMNAESEADLLEPICKALEDGLRVEPAELCAPFLEATLIFCRRSSDEDQILALIDFVAKGVDSINNSGGKEHLAFFTNVLTQTNERAGLDESWFISQVVEKVPEWSPPLLLYPEKTVRNMTLEVLRQILFNKDPLNIEVAKELVQSCVDRLKKTYLAGPRHNIESRVVEPINSVISHGLEAYRHVESEEDQEFVEHAHDVLAAIDDLTIDLPEELASESDLPSPEDWEDNSIMASDSEMGMLGTP